MRQYNVVILTFDVNDCAIHETFTSHYFNLISYLFTSVHLLRVIFVYSYLIKKLL